ncbi:MAG: M23 family metallopeptidase [Candidatus Thorarchaeota archaeon]|nr:M23 family metallopeptidase [Candidatus Thorarchaeota archaeon]
MKKATIILIMLVIIGGFAVVLYQMHEINENTFDTGGRYDPSVLDYMGVIYANRSDIEGFNEGYSGSTACPWGFVHNGIDYFYFNNSDVIAAAPGLVEKIELHDWGLEAQHRYTISVEIRFNASVNLLYNFEPWTNSTDEQAQQVEMFNIEVGSWVTKGDVIAKFLHAGEGAHIHFGIYQDGEARDPTLYLSTDGYNELLEMIHDFHPTWEISYP